MVDTNNKLVQSPNQNQEGEKANRGKQLHFHSLIISLSLSPLQFCKSKLHNSVAGPLLRSLASHGSRRLHPHAAASRSRPRQLIPSPSCVAPPLPRRLSSSVTNRIRAVKSDRIAGFLGDWCFGTEQVVGVIVASRVTGLGFCSGVCAPSSVLRLYQSPKEYISFKMRYSRGRRSFPLCLFAVVCLMAQLGACNVVLMANNTTLSFDDVEATFNPAVKGSGINGIIYAVEPLDACNPLSTKASEGSASPFALITRGGCQFDDKVRNAQSAGFEAAIVYDNEDSGVLVSMAGSSSGVHICAVFISKASGEVLKKYSGQSDVELWIIPSYENSAWSIMAISFILLLAMSAILATCFFVRRHQIRRDRARLPEARQFHGMSSQLVKAMPSLIFTKVQEDNCTSSSCAICLEDYSVGEKIRVLPCRHKFHAACVDLWLTSWRTFCPVCKRDAMAGTTLNLPVSEFTPLLSSVIRFPAESSALGSFRSTVAASSPRPISRHPSSQSISRNYSLSGSGIPRTPNPHRSYANPPPICTSGSNVDLAHMSSPWSRTSHLASAHSLCGGHLSPPINIRYTSPYVSRSGYGSPSQYIGSSHISRSGCGSPNYYPGSSGQQHPYLRHCTLSGPSLFTMVLQSPQQTLLQHGGDSETSLSAAASTQSFRQLYLQHCPDSDTSAQSLPGC